MAFASSRSMISKGLILALLFGILVPARAFAAPRPFNDTADSYARMEIDALSEAGILSGAADDTFLPTGPITRAELAKIMVLSLRLAEKPDGASAFRDVEPDSWYSGYVGAIMAAGITGGTSAETYSPNATVTREELVVFIIRALGLDDTAIRLATDLKAADSDSVSVWAKAQVALAYRIGLINGTADNGGSSLFEPKKSAERQAVARLAYELRTNRDHYVGAAQALLPNGDSAGTGTTGDSKETAPAVTGINAVHSNTVEVTFASEPKSASKEQFSFSNGLTVLEASIKSGSPNVVVLTTSVMTSGMSYTLSYDGRPTVLSVTGVAASAPIGAVGFVGPGDSDDSDGSDSSMTKEQINQLLSSGTPQGTITITESGTYGAASGPPTTVDHLIIDPGPTGEVFLQNINPDELEVLSGAPDSIKLLNTVIKQLKVNAINNGGRDVRIEARDGASSETVEVQSSAVLETGGGTLGKITLLSGATNKTLTLKGPIEDDVEVKGSGSKIQLQPPSVTNPNPLPTKLTNLIVSTSAYIEAYGGTTLQNISLSGNNPSLQLSGSGTVEKVEVDESASGATLQLGEGTNVNTITAKSPLTLTGPASVIAKVKQEGAIQMDEDLRNRIKSIAVANAIAAIRDLGDFSTYSAEFLAKLDKANTAYSTATETYGATDAEITNADDLVSVKNAVAQLKANVDQELADLNIFQGDDNESSVTNNLNLKSASSFGNSIVWSSDRPDVVHAVTGSVTRPVAGQPDSNVTLTAVVSQKGYSNTRTFIVTVKPAEPLVVTQLVRTGSDTLEVWFNQPPRLIEAADFTFDNGLDVLSVDLTPGMSFAVLHTGTPMAQTTYTLSYKGVNTGKSFTVQLTSPVLLTAEAGIHQVKLTWSTVIGATYYSIYKMEKGGSGFTLTGGAYFPDSFPGGYGFVTGLEAGKEYDFYITATNGAATSDPSNQVGSGPIIALASVNSVWFKHQDESVASSVYLVYDSVRQVYQVPSEMDSGDWLYVSFGDGPDTGVWTGPIGLSAIGSVIVNDTGNIATVENDRTLAFRPSLTVSQLTPGSVYPMEVTGIIYGPAGLPIAFTLRLRG